MITIEQIKNDLETAAYVDRLLPPVRAQGYQSYMPQIIYTPQEIAFMDRRPIRPRPNQEQINIWEEVVLRWLPILTKEERRLVWKKANNLPWKMLCRDFGVCKSNLCERYSKALLKIEFFLKGRKNV